jgi:hypothetical protein
MTGTATTDANTLRAYLFIRTGMRKGKVFGYWKDGGWFRPGDEDAEAWAFIDMLPRGGWDGRIRFVKTGDPPPQDQPSPQRPGVENGGEEESED